MTKQTTRERNIEENDKVLETGCVFDESINTPYSQMADTREKTGA